MKFIKENKLAVLSIGSIVLCAIFLALPGQFAHFGIVGDGYLHYLSGYQFFFNTYKNTLGNAIGSVVGAGIAIIVLAAVAIALICLWKKSSFFVLLAAIVNLVIAILFFNMENFAAKAYPFTPFEGRSFVGWPTYLCGAIIILVALYLGYKAVMMMRDEVKHPSAPKGPKYDYLRK